MAQAPALPAGFEGAEDGEGLAAAALAGAATVAAPAAALAVDGLADLLGADTLVGVVVPVDAGGAALG